MTKPWPYYAATLVFTLVAILFAGVAYLSLAADSQPLPTPQPDATWPVIPAVAVATVNIPTYPVDAHGNIIAVLVTTTPEPTWTPMAYVWPTPTATPIPTPIRDFAADVETGGR